MGGKAGLSGSHSDDQNPLVRQRETDFFVCKRIVSGHYAAPINTVIIEYALAGHFGFVLSLSQMVPIFLQATRLLQLPYMVAQSQPLWLGRTVFYQQTLPQKKDRSVPDVLSHKPPFLLVLQGSKLHHSPSSYQRIHPPSELLYGTVYGSAKIRRPKQGCWVIESALAETSLH